MSDYRNWFLFSAACGTGSMICFLLAWLEGRAGIVTRLLPTPQIGMVYVAGLALGILIVANRGRVRMPPFRIAGPRAKYRTNRYETYRRVKP